MYWRLQSKKSLNAGGLMATNATTSGRMHPYLQSKTKVDAGGTCGYEYNHQLMRECTHIYKARSRWMREDGFVDMDVATGKLTNPLLTLAKTHNQNATYQWVGRESCLSVT